MAQRFNKFNGIQAGATVAVAGIVLSTLAGLFSSANAQYRGTPEMQQA
jgi:hypothetical protein